MMMRYVTDEDTPETSGLRAKRTAAVLFGILLLGVSYQMFLNASSQLMSIGHVAGSVTALVVWFAQIRARRVRWWRTTLVGGGIATFVVWALYVIGGGDMDSLANAIVASGVTLTGFVAVGPAAALHLISFGGWGAGTEAREPREEADIQEGDCVD